MTDILINIRGMKCQSCSSTLERKIKKLLGVIEVQVSLVNSTAYVQFDASVISILDIKKCINMSGYEVIEHIFPVDKKVPEEHNNIPISHMGTHKISIWLVSFNIISAIILMIFSMGIESMWLYVISCLICSCMLWFNRSVIHIGARSLRNWHPNMYTLIFLGFIVGYVYSFIVLFVQCFYYNINLPLYFDTAAAILAFNSIGEFLQQKAKDKIQENLGEITSILPARVHILENGEEKEIVIENVSIGSILVVKPGEIIPLDGILVDHNGYLIETLLSGELEPVLKEIDSDIVSGTYAHNQVLYIKVSKTFKESFFYKLKGTLLDIERKKTPILLLVDKISYYFVPFIIVLSLFLFLGWGLFLHNWLIALKTSIAVLVVACPCALGLATPLAISIFFGTAFQQGFLIKNSRILERIGKLDTCFLDKTGTITTGELLVTEWGIPHSKELDSYILSIEKLSTHPYARAIVKYLKENTQANSLAVDDFKIHEGHGLQGKINGSTIQIGNSLWFNNLSKEQENIQDFSLSLGKIILWISVDSVIKGYILLEDHLREGIENWVHYARKEGLSLKILSGDHMNSVAVIAKTLAITEFQGQLKPFDKLEEVKTKQSQGHSVLMIGDGINDSLVLKQSDLSISFAHGSDISMHSADVVLLTEDIGILSTLMQFIKKTKSIIKENLIFAFLYNLLMIPWASGLFYIIGGSILNPMFGALSMALSSIFVIINSLRLLKFENE